MTHKVSISDVLEMLKNAQNQAEEEKRMRLVAEVERGVAEENLEEEKGRRRVAEEKTHRLEFIEKVESIFDLP